MGKVIIGNYRSFLYVALFGSMEGILLRGDGDTGAKILFIFSFYHVILAAYFYLTGYFFGFRWLPAFILIQDFFSHMVEYLYDRDEFWSTWIQWPFGVVVGLPFVYWLLLVLQIYIFIDNKRRV